MPPGALAEAFHEVYKDTPRIVSHTARKFGAKRAEAQRVAIALEKARKAGAKIPRQRGRLARAMEEK